MEEKKKASQGAAPVTKSENLGGQAAVLKADSAWQGTNAPSVPMTPSQDNSPDEPPARGAPRSKKPAEKQVIADQIGRQLRTVYNDVLAQPVPDRFLDLLRTLEKDPK